MDNIACRVCKSPLLNRELYYERAPRNIERLLREDQLANDRPISLEVLRCELCGHIQLGQNMADDYYEEYLMSHSHAPKMQQFQRAQAGALVSEMGLAGKKVFEAGCGDGQYSLLLEELGCEVLANEPSAKARRACEEKGLATLGGYLTNEAFDELHGTFDAFVARQVLEHVPDPNDFVQGMRNLLKPGGVALIEVPSLEKALEDARFFDFFPDHLSYFSATTLQHLFLRNYFEIVRVQRAMDGEYNEIWVRKMDLPQLATVQLAADNIASAYRQFLAVENAASRRVAVWGAGAKGVLTFSLVDTEGIAYLIDKDQVKHGLLTPISHLKVFPPARLLEDPVDTVLITALAYKDEIAKELKNNYNFTGKITYLHGGQIKTMES